MKGRIYVLRADGRRNAFARTVTPDPSDADRKHWAICLEVFCSRRREGIPVERRGLAKEIKGIRQRTGLDKKQISDRSLRRAIQPLFDEELDIIQEQASSLPKRKF
jgi:hypothetical protein